MMTIKETVLILSLLTASLMGFEIENAAQTDSLQVLYTQMKNLSLEVEELKRNSAASPIKSASYRKWGEGLYVGVEYPSLSAEVGFAFKIIPQGLKLGLGVGYTYLNENIYDQGKYRYIIDGYEENNMYWKFFMESPVLFNLMNFSVSYSQLYAMETDPSKDLHVVVNNTGIEDIDEIEQLSDIEKIDYIESSSGELRQAVLGLQAGFWLAKRIQVYSGINIYFHSFENLGELTRIDENGKSEPVTSYENIRWVTNGFKVGVKYYFGTFRDMKQRRKSRIE